MTVATQLTAAGWDALAEEPGEKLASGQYGPRGLRVECRVCGARQRVSGPKPGALPETLPAHRCPGRATPPPAAPVGAPA